MSKKLLAVLTLTLVFSLSACTNPFQKTETQDDTNNSEINSELENVVTKEDELDLIDPSLLPVETNEVETEEVTEDMLDLVEAVLENSEETLEVENVEVEVEKNAE